MTEPLRVLAVTPEAAPFAKSGGLADVLGALPQALRQRGIDVRLLMPRYGSIPRDSLRRHPAPLGVPLGSGERWCALLEGRIGDVPTYFLEHDVFFDRPHLYGPPGSAYPDNGLRFALLSRGALQLCHYLSFWPDVIHANDWQAALLPVYLNTVTRGTRLERVASVLTIHNLAYQGWTSPTDAMELGLGSDLRLLGLEAYGAINLLKGGIHHATLVTTVSPSYAREIQTPWYGEGLDVVLRSRSADLFGVMNGIDVSVWDPERDPLIPRSYGRQDLSGKAYCKAALQQEAGLAPRPEVPLVGIVTRLSAQKGIDLVVAALDRLLDLDLQLVVLGTGDDWAEDLFRGVQSHRPDRFRAWIAFDERRAHLIEAGADFFLMPSRWEPCGLNQLYSLRYGTIPIVRATGGLHDTGQAFDRETGSGTCFKFYDLGVDALVSAVGEAVDVFRTRRIAIAAMIERGMAEDHSWARAAASYEYFYRLAKVRRLGG